MIDSAEYQGAQAISFSTDANKYAIANKDGEINIYSLKGFSHLKQIQNKGTVFAIAFSNNSDKLAIAHFEGVKVFSLND